MAKPEKILKYEIRLKKLFKTKRVFIYAWTNDRIDFQVSPASKIAIAKYFTFREHGLWYVSANFKLDNACFSVIKHTYNKFHLRAKQIIKARKKKETSHESV